MLNPEACTAPTAKSESRSAPGEGCRQSPASDQQCYFNYCKSVMAAKPSLAFLLLTGNLAGQWLCFQWKSVGFDCPGGRFPPGWIPVGRCSTVLTSRVAGSARGGCKGVGSGSSSVCNTSSVFLLLILPSAQRTLLAFARL